jgi:hypothetical protein
MLVQRLRQMVPKLPFMLLITIQEVMVASAMDPQVAHYLVKPCTPQVRPVAALTDELPSLSFHVPKIAC